MVTDGDYTYRGEHFVMYIVVESLCCASEANIILYINYFNKKTGTRKTRAENPVGFWVLGCCMSEGPLAPLPGID